MSALSASWTRASIGPGTSPSESQVVPSTHDKASMLPQHESFSPRCSSQTKNGSIGAHELGPMPISVSIATGESLKNGEEMFNYPIASHQLEQSPLEIVSGTEQTSWIARYVLTRTNSTHNRAQETAQEFEKKFGRAMTLDEIRFAWKTGLHEPAPEAKRKEQMTYIIGFLPQSMPLEHVGLATTGGKPMNEKSADNEIAGPTAAHITPTTPSEDAESVIFTSESQYTSGHARSDKPPAPQIKQTEAGILRGNSDQSISELYNLITPIIEDNALALVNEAKAKDVQQTFEKQPVAVEPVLQLKHMLTPRAPLPPPWKYTAEQESWLLSYYSKYLEVTGLRGGKYSRYPAGIAKAFFARFRLQRSRDALIGKLKNLRAHVAGFTKAMEKSVEETTSSVDFLDEAFLSFERRQVAVPVVVSDGGHITKKRRLLPFNGPHGSGDRMGDPIIIPESDGSNDDEVNDGSLSTFGDLMDNMQAESSSLSIPTIDDQPAITDTVSALSCPNSDFQTLEPKQISTPVINPTWDVPATGQQIGSFTMDEHLWLRHHVMYQKQLEPADSEYWLALTQEFNSTFNCNRSKSTITELCVNIKSVVGWSGGTILSRFTQYTPAEDEWLGVYCSTRLREGLSVDWAVVAELFGQLFGKGRTEDALRHRWRGIRKKLAESQEV